MAYINGHIIPDGRAVPPPPKRICKIFGVECREASELFCDNILDCREWDKSNFRRFDHLQKERGRQIELVDEDE